MCWDQDFGLRGSEEIDQPLRAYPSHVEDPCMFPSTHVG